MRLTVFGATGGTGAQVVDQGLAAGYKVLAVVRDPSRLPADRVGLDVVAADVMDPASIVDAVTRSDAVVSTIGTRNGRAPTTVCADSSGSIIEAMQKAETRRLIVVSGTGPFDDGEGPGMRYLLKPIARLFLKNVFADFVAMEENVRTSGLDWTIVRPSRLTDKPLTHEYRTRRELNLRRNFTVSRADLAHLILVVSGDHDTYGATIHIGN